MSDAGTNDSREPDDAVPAEPASAPDAASGVVPSFEVPDAESVDVPDAETAAADFDVPPPPTFDAPPPVPAAPGEDPAADTGARKRRSPDAAPTPPPSVQAAMTRAAAREAAGREGADAKPNDPAVVPPETGPDNSYRAWTVAIFAGLAVLLIAAVVWLVVLINSAPLPFASSEADVLVGEIFAFGSAR